MKLDANRVLPDPHECRALGTTQTLLMSLSPLSVSAGSSYAFNSKLVHIELTTLRGDGA